MAVRGPLPSEEEARLARLVAEGKQAMTRLAEPGISVEERQRLDEVASQGREALAGLVEHNLPLALIDGYRGGCVTGEGSATSSGISLKR